MFSAFNPSKCTHLEQWAADCAAPREQSWTSCRSRDSNPQPWVTSGFKSNALSIRPTTAQSSDSSVEPISSKVFLFGRCIRGETFILTALRTAAHEHTSAHILLCVRRRRSVLSNTDRILSNKQNC